MIDLSQLPALKSSSHWISRASIPECCWRPPGADGRWMDGPRWESDPVVKLARLCACQVQLPRAHQRHRPRSVTAGYAVVRIWNNWRPMNVSRLLVSPGDQSLCH